MLSIAWMGYSIYSFNKSQINQLMKYRYTYTLHVMCHVYVLVVCVALALTPLLSLTLSPSRALFLSPFLSGSSPYLLLSHLTCA